ncbi:hypothetical protein DQ384_38150 [Sphaerisporangium album]|uniref:Ribbon-helix-helix protein, CopG family n=1 Tax=Sphaerisporangium album TaxID=509200 RepID=A0A367END5_9ACTN|nr:hypothetical protein [Sphaerisporangium album]RCG19105.1 hypothetical protein DQ384_38150 [Sphaerisporangium album]
MSDSTRGGRPPVGTPITTTIPDELLAEIDRRAAMSGGTRAAEVRDLLASSLGLFGGPIELPVSEWGRVAEEVRPATELLARWISHNPAKALKRYRDYRVRSLDPDRLLRVIDVARGELQLARQPSRHLDAELLDRLGSESGRPARSLLAATVMQELDRQGLFRAIELLDRATRAIEEGARLSTSGRQGDDRDVALWLSNSYEIRLLMDEQWRNAYEIAKSVVDELGRAGFEVVSPSPGVDVCALLSMRVELEVRPRS